ncbi:MULTISPECIES: NAD-dependent epimerase/dehydratase family protein [Streptomyces]|uniref:NAD-dependent epimerase/dehydratase family protein n=1 Tax=Streptomyces TaxID=1883 RepID=UPI00374E0CE6
MRVLLTGGSGFVGQHLIRRSRSEGHDVVALARSAAMPPEAVHQEARDGRGHRHADQTGRQCGGHAVGRHRATRRVDEVFPRHRG